MGTFAGRVPPKTEAKKAIFDAIKQEYYDSKLWAQEMGLVWKEKIDGVFSTQLCWKTMKMILDSEMSVDFEHKMQMAKNAWRYIVKGNFEVRDA